MTIGDDSFSVEMEDSTCFAWFAYRVVRFDFCVDGSVSAEGSFYDIFSWAI